MPSNTPNPRTPNPLLGAGQQRITTLKRQSREQMVRTLSRSQSVAFTPPAPEFNPHVGVRESEARSSKLAKDVWELQMRLKLELELKERREKEHAKIRAELKQTKQELTTLRQECSSLHDAVDERDEIINTLHAELEKQERVVADAQLVNQSYQEYILGFRDKIELYQEGTTGEAFPNGSLNDCSSFKDVERESRVSERLDQAGHGPHMVSPQSPPPSEEARSEARSYYSSGSSSVRSPSFSGSLVLPSEEDISSLFRNDEALEEHFVEETKDPEHKKVPRLPVAEIAKRTGEHARFFKDARKRGFFIEEKAHQDHSHVAAAPSTPETAYVPSMEASMTVNRLPREPARHFSYELVDIAEADSKASVDSELPSRWPLSVQHTQPANSASNEFPSPPASPPIDVWLQEAQSRGSRKVQRHANRMSLPQSPGRFSDLSLSPETLATPLHMIHDGQEPSMKETRCANRMGPKLAARLHMVLEEQERSRTETRGANRMSLPLSPERFADLSLSPGQFPGRLHMTQGDHGQGRKESQETILRLGQLESDLFTSESGSMSLPTRRKDAIPETPKAKNTLHSMLARSARRIGLGSRKSKIVIPKISPPGEKKHHIISRKSSWESFRDLNDDDQSILSRENSGRKPPLPTRDTGSGRKSWRPPGRSLLS